MVGKTTLINRIKGGELTTEFKKLGLDAIQDWEMMLANELFRMSACRPANLIVHLDLYEQLHKRARHEWLNQLLEQYDVVFDLTLCTHHKRLKSRIGLRLNQLFKKRWPFIKFQKILKRLKPRSEKRVFYSELSSIKDLYQQYHDFLSDLPNMRAQWLMDTSKMDNSILLPFEKDLFLELLDGIKRVDSAEFSSHKTL